MARVVVELTNRCNLACSHCFDGRHGGSNDLPLHILEAVLTDARSCGFDSLSFTGGEPTVHPQFPDVIRQTHAAGYRFGFVTNGWSLPAMLPRILPYREGISYITLSVDGATEASHDRLRGAGAFRRVMAGISSCVAYGVPFTINMVLTGSNQHEIEALVDAAVDLGAHGVRLDHLMHNRTTTGMGMDLAPGERKAVEARIWDLQQRASIPVAMGPGHYTTSLFPCAPLHMLEVNVNCRGDLTKCCHLSGHGSAAGDGDVAGNLRDMSFAEGIRRLRAANEEFHKHKMRRLTEGRMTDSDYFPCWYCVLHFEKAEWLRNREDHPWSPLMWRREGGAKPRYEGPLADEDLVRIREI